MSFSIATSPKAARCQAHLLPGRAAFQPLQMMFGLIELVRYMPEFVEGTLSAGPPGWAVWSVTFCFFNISLKEKAEKATSLESVEIKVTHAHKKNKVLSFEITPHQTTTLIEPRLLKPKIQ